MHAVSKLASSLTNAVDLRLITEGGPNVLLVGPDVATLEALEEIAAALCPPIVCWPGDGAPWDSRSEPRTVILHDVARLNHAEQTRLLAWVRRRGRSTQLLSRSSIPVHPLVVQRRFIEELYYCLNVVYVECF